MTACLHVETETNFWPNPAYFLYLQYSVTSNGIQMDEDKRISPFFCTFTDPYNQL